MTFQNFKTLLEATDATVRVATVHKRNGFGTLPDTSESFQPMCVRFNARKINRMPTSEQKWQAVFGSVSTRFPTVHGSSQAQLDMHQLAQALAQTCRENLLNEKWLIAPSRRVGQQWLESVTRSGQPAVNVHVKTVTSLAVDLAAAKLTADGVTLLSSRGGQFLIDRLLHRLRPTELSYLSEMKSSDGLAISLFETLGNLRLTEIGDTDINLKLFEAAEKGEDLRRLLRSYVLELQSNHLIDAAGLYQLAASNLRSGVICLPDDLLLLVPADLELTRLERKLLQAFPDSRRHTLPIDEPAKVGESAANDLELLRWLDLPNESPPPLRDGTVGIRCAVGEVNEVRDVLRCCVSRQLRFDEIELLHTEADTYVPLVYESFCLMAREGETLGDDLPVTFAEGIPCRYSRPGRALSLWLGWIGEDFPQRILVQMLKEGLLKLNQTGDPPLSSGRLSGLLRDLGIGFGRERYAEQLQARIAGIRHQLEDPAEPDAEDEPRPDWRDRLQRQLREFQALADLCGQLLACTPTRISRPTEVLTGAEKFLTDVARAVNRIDQFAADKLVSDLRELRHWLSVGDGEAGTDVWAWLARLPSEARVLGSGPRPGCLHVAHVLSGGHTGRPHTFIIGLDDTRFPGAGLQDPLLLDSERTKLSPELMTAARALEQKRIGFTRLLARLRGTLTLSFCMRTVDDDRELFASGLLLAVYRLVSGERSGDQSGLTAWLSRQSPPSSFAPRDPSECLNATEWWLWRLCGETAVREPESLVLKHYPHLAQGRRAAGERRGSVFTKYDGHVAEAGPDLDPTSPTRALSANRLQKIGKCPLMYFFEYGLDIVPPEDLQHDPTCWLDALATGSLLHELFEKFLRELLPVNQIPCFERDQNRLRELLAAQVARYRTLYPVPSESVFQQQRAQLEQVALTFLREEEQHCARTGSRPAYLEVSLGMDAEEHGTPLDTPDPVPILLNDQTAVQLRGRVDRIDRVGDGAVQTFAVWDYKTGGTWGYDRSQPFQQGRILQPYLYVTMVSHRLRTALSPDAEVSYFGFFFPGIKARGERITWSRDDLAAGSEILEQLVQTIRHGAFLATNEPDDCRFCNYRTICGDATAVTDASRAKLDNPVNTLLTPMRKLRHV